MTTFSNTLALVAVRLKSERLPRKALKDLAGKPLLLRLTERISRARRVDKVVWCTSTNPQDDPIAELAQANHVRLFRGHEQNVLARFIGAAEQFGGSILIRVTGDNPLTDPENMDHMIDSHRQANADYSYTEDLPRGTRCEIVNLELLHRVRQLAQDPNASEYMTLMLRRPDRFKVHRVSAPNPSWVWPTLRLTVDTPADFQVVSAIFEYFKGEPPPLGDLLPWLRGHPEITQMNAGIEVREIDSSINTKLLGDK